MNLKEIETQRMSLLEQIKDLKFQERTDIENILKEYFSDFVEITWYDDNEDSFRIFTDDFYFSKLQNVSQHLQNWIIYIKAYDNDCIEIEFDRIKK